jgi:hypothetical protein
MQPCSPNFVALSSVRLTLSLFGVPAVLFEFAHAGVPLAQPQPRIIGGGNYAKRRFEFGYLAPADVPRITPRALAASAGRALGRRSSSSSLAMLPAIRRASSRISSLAHRLASIRYAPIATNFRSVGK